MQTENWARYFTSTSLATALEPRMMFDAAAVATVADAAAQDVAQEAAQQVQDSAAASDTFQAEQDLLSAFEEEPLATQPSNGKDQQAPKPSDALMASTLVVVDPNIKDYEQLLETVPEAAQILVLSEGGDAIGEISAFLADQSNISSLHILSHGQDGDIFLNNTLLSQDTLSQYAEQISGWSGAFNANADILFYGCDIGSENGLALLTQIADLTATDIAASSDDTGAINLGGDWVLETNIGTVETSTLFTENTVPAFSHLLAPPLNDLVADAFNLGDIESISIDATTVDSTNTDVVAATGGDPTNSIWFTWTAPDTGTVNLFASGSFSKAISFYNDTLTTRLGNTSVTTNDVSLTQSVTAGTTYFFALHGSGEGLAQVQLSVVSTLPDNDLTANAIVLGNESNIVWSSSTIEAANIGDVVISGGDLANSVWYKWTAVTNGTLVITAPNTGFSKGLALYNDTLGSRLEITSNSTSAKSITRAVTAGTTFFISHFGSGEGVMNITLNHASVPPNDLTADVIDVGNGSNIVWSSSNIEATNVGDVVIANGDQANSVWYKWTAIANGTLVITAPNTGFSKGLALYNDTLGSRLEITSNSTSAKTITRAVTAGTTFFISHFGTGEGVMNITLTHGNVPANDLTTNAFVVGNDSNIVWTSSTIEATNTGDVVISLGDPQNSVWYKWTATANGTLTLSAPATAFSKGLAIYNDTLGSRLGIASSSTVVRTITLATTAGTTYFISHFGSQEGVMDITISHAAVPDNDLTSNAFVVGDDPNIVWSSSNVEATNTGDVSIASGDPANSVWYKWTATVNGVLTLSAPSTSFSKGLAIYNDTLGSRLGISGSSTAARTISLAVTSGTTYFITHFGNNENVVDITINIAPLPDNDLTAGAVELGNPNNIVWDSNNVQATNTGDVAISLGDLANSIWYKWVAPITGTVTVSAPSTVFSKGLAAYNEALTSRLAIAGSSTVARSINFAVTSGTTYFITHFGNNEGTVTITLNIPAGSINDNFANALETTTSSTISNVSLDGTTVGATAEAGEPAHAGVAAADSVWYFIEPSVFQSITVDIVGSATGARIAVYEDIDTTLAGLLLVGQDSNGTNSSVSFDVTSLGKRYYIALDSISGVEGPITVNLTPTSFPLPLNDIFGSTSLGTSDNIKLANETNLKLSGTDTAEVGEPLHAGVADGKHSVWYTWTASKNGIMTFDTDGSVIDTVLAVYTGTAVNALTEIGSNDDTGDTDSSVTFQAIAGTTYRIVVDAKSGDGGLFNLNGTFGTPAPSNELFANATPLGNAASTNLANESNLKVDGTAEVGEPLHAGISNTRSNWYTWVAPQDGVMTFDTDGSVIDTVLAVYTGADVNALTEVISNDDTGDTDSSVTFQVVSGTTFHIAVDAKTGDGGLFNLSGTFGPAAPANELFANPTLLGNADSLNLANESNIKVGGTAEVGEPLHAGISNTRSVWYSWVAATNGIVTFDTDGSVIDTVLAVYTGIAVNNLTTIASNDDTGDTDSSVTFQAIAGTTYHIAVDAKTGDGGSFNLNLSLDRAPINNDFANARDLGNVGKINTDVVITTSNVGATFEVGEQNHAGLAASNSVWWVWVAPELGAVTFSTTGGFNTRVAVYENTDDTLANLVLVGQNTNGPDSSVTFNVTSIGTKYFIVVDSASVNVTGSTTLNLNTAFISLPVNDLFANSIDLTGVQNFTILTNNAMPIGAEVVEANEPNHAGVVGTGKHSIWYSWTAADSATYTLDTVGSFGDTILAIYTGTALTNLVEVGSSDDGTDVGTASRITFNATAGTTFHFVVDSVAQGNVVALNLTQGAITTPALLNDLSVNAIDLGDVSFITFDSSNVGATATEGAMIEGTSNFNSVWFKWEAHTTGRVDVTFTTDYVGVLRVMSTDFTTTFTTINQSVAGASTTTFDAIAGTVYLLSQSSGFADVEGNATITLDNVRPIHDLKANAIDLGAFDDSITFDSDNTKASNTEASDITNSVWYTWTAPISGLINITTTSADHLQSFRVLASNQTTVITTVAKTGAFGVAAGSFEAVNGQTYFFGHGRNSGTTDGIVTITLAYGNQQPFDLTADAMDLGNNNNITWTSNNIGGTSTETIPFGDLGNSVWYIWTAPETGLYSLSAPATAFSKQLALYDDALTTRFNATSSTTVAVSFNFNAVVGQKFLIAHVGGSEGTMDISLSLINPVAANDLIANVVDLGNPNNITWTSDNTESTNTDAGIPFGDLGNSVWYTWTAPEAGVYTLSAPATGFAKQLALYDDALTTRFNATSSTTVPVSFIFNALAAQKFFIVHAGGSEGAVAISLSFTRPFAANDLIANVVDLGDPRNITWTSDNTESTNTDAGIPFGDLGNSVWYKWTAPETGIYTLSAPSTAFSKQLAVYDEALTTRFNATSSTTIAVSIEFSATAAQKFFIVHAGGSEGAVAISLAFTRFFPANDLVANPVDLGNPSDITWTSSNIEATNTDATVPFGDLGNSVWYTWTAPEAGVYTLSAPITAFSKQLAVYNEAFSTRLNITSSTTIAVSIEFSATTAGDKFFIVHAGGSEGAVAISLSFTRPFAANDSVANALALGDANSMTWTSDNTEATNTDVVPGGDGISSVWYTWTAPEAGIYTLSAPSTAISKQVAVYNGAFTTRLNLTPLTTAAVSIEFSVATAGDQFFIAHVGSEGAVAISLAFTRSFAANDLVANALALGDPNSITWTSSNIEATNTDVVPGGDGINSVWYTWTAPETGLYDLSAPSTAISKQLAVYNGAFTTRLNLTPLTTAAVSIAFNATAGDQFFIAHVGSEGAIAITVDLPTASSVNDNLANATIISGSDIISGIIVNGTTVGATAEASEPAHAGLAAADSIWYRVDPVTYGNFTASTTGSVVSTRIAVYEDVGKTGTFATFVLIGQDSNGSNSSVAFSVENAGTTTNLGKRFYIAIDSVAGAEGAVQLNFTTAFFQPPPNDNFASATIVTGSNIVSGITINATTAGATAEVGEPQNNGLNAEDSIWYRFDPVTFGTFTFTTVGSANNTRISLFQNINDTFGGLVLIDSDSTGTDSSVSVTIENSGTTTNLGKEFYIVVDTTGVEGAVVVNFNTTFFTPPVNDNFANATVVSGSSVIPGNIVLNATTAGATAEASEPLHGGSAAEDSIWFRWDPATFGNFTISTTGISTRLVVYENTNDTFAGLALVGQDSGANSSVAFSIENAGTTTNLGKEFYIAVDTVAGTEGAVVVTINTTFFTPPVNDSFANATIVSGSSVIPGNIVLNATTAGATAEASEPLHGGSAAEDSIWFRWDPAIFGNFTVSTTGISTRLVVYENIDDTFAGLVVIGQDSGVNSSVAFSIENAGTTTNLGKEFYIAVDTVAGTEGAVVVTINTTFFTPPVNDSFANALKVSGSDVISGVIVSGTIVGATAEAGEPLHDGSAAEDSAWWFFEPADFATYTITTTGSAVSTRVAIFRDTNTTLAGLVSVASDSNGANSSVTFDVTNQGERYYVAVDSDIVADAEGAIRLNITPTFFPLPGNDDFANPILLGNARNFEIPGNNLKLDGTDAAETNEPMHAGVSDGAHSVWHTWIAPLNGSLQLNTVGSAIDTVLAVYSGSALNSLVQVAANDDSGGTTSLVTFSVTEGTTYRIVVDAKTGSGGAIALNGIFSPGPLNDAFARAESIGNIGQVNSNISVTGNNLLAFADAGEPNLVGVAAANSVWWSWTSPTFGNVTVSTNGSAVDTRLGVRRDVDGTLANSVLEGENANGSISSVNFNVTAEGTKYFFVVDSVAGVTGNLQVNLVANLVPLPENDPFATADKVGNVPNFIVLGNNERFTGTGLAEVGEPGHAGLNTADFSTWWEWTSPETRVYRLDTVGSAFDTVLGAYVIGSFIEIASNNDGAGIGTASRFDFTAIQGTTYYFAVASTGAEGDIQLNLDQLSAATNPPNTAPTLNDGSVGNLTSINENEVDSSGTTVSLLLNDANAVTDPDIGAVEGIVVFDVDNGAGGAWQYSLDGMNWSNFGSVSASSARLLAADGTTAVRFVPSLGAVGSSAHIDFRGWDQTIGTNGDTTNLTVLGTGGNTAFSTETSVRSITVIDINFAPVIDNTGTMALDAIDEDNTVSGGTSVANIIASAGGDRITDLDSGDPEGIAVIGAVTTNGTWQYSTDNGMNWSPMGAVASDNARLLNASALIRFVPSFNFNGTATITFRAWDQSSGTNGGTADLVVTGVGGNTAFSTATETADITVNAINDAPVNAVPGVQSTNEDVNLVFSSGNGNAISVADVDTSALQMQLTATNGTLTLASITGLSFMIGTGTADATMLFIGAISSINPALNGMFYTPTLNFSGPSSVTIVSNDSLLSDTDVVNITVNPLNDAPTISDITDKSTNEDTATSAIPFTIGDVETAPSSLTVTATSSNQGIVPNGNISLGGTDANRTITLTPIADQNGATTITVRVDDGTTITDDTFVLTVDPVNDAPTLDNSGTPALTTIDQNDTANNGDLVSTFAGLISDIDASAVEGIAVTAVDNTNGTWQYSTDNGANWTDFGTPTVGVARLLAIDANTRIRFVPNNNFFGAAGNITFQAWDQTSGSNGGTGDASNNGGTTAFSTATETAGITVNEIFLNLGDEFIVANAGTVENDPSVAWLNNGNFVATWQTASDSTARIKARIFDAAGSALSSVIDVDPDIAQAIDPTVVALQNGGFAVTWVESTASKIQLQLFDASGNKVGGPIEVSSAAPLSLGDGAKSMAVLSDGKIVVGYQVGSSGNNVFYRIFNENGTAFTGEVQVNTASNVNFIYRNASIAALQNGGFVVAGTYFIGGLHPSGPSQEIFFRVFSSSGTAVTGQISADSLPGDVFAKTAVATGLEDGNFALTWDIGNSNTIVRVFSPLGAGISSEVILSSSAVVPHVANLDTGGFVVTYEDTSTDKVTARIFGANGSPVEPAFVVNDTLASASSSARELAYLDANQNNEVVVVWRSGDDIAARVFTLGPNNAPVLDNSGTPTLTAINEDTAAVAIMGDTVAAILATGAGGDPITDADPGALEGIVVTAIDNTNGVWQYSIDSGMNWSVIGVVSDSSALLLASDDLVRFIPSNNFNGTVTNGLTFRAWDQTSGTNGTKVDVSNNGGATAFSTATESASITINAVNDVPTISDIGNQTIDEDTNTGALAVTVGDVETAPGSLTLTGDSSNTTLVPVVNIVFGGSGANRTVTVTPAANQFGTATITITVDDGTDTAFDTFVVTVTSVNDAPTISDIGNQITNEDVPTGAIAFTVGDVETAAGSLTLTGISDDTILIPNANIVFGGSGANRTVTITPAPELSGTTTITIRVSDGLLNAEDTFDITVTTVNDAPTITAISDQTIDEDTNTGALAFTIGDAETAASSLVVTSGSSNQTLVPDANVVVTGSGASRAVTVTPVANQSGTATITVSVSDGNVTTPETFLLTVDPVNDVPTISDITDKTIDEDTSTGVIVFTISDVETPIGSLIVTASSSNQTLAPDGNLVIGGSGNRITVTPAANQFGTATITVTVSDGVDSAQDTFLLTVNPINDVPTISDITDKSTNEDTATSAIAFTVGDVETAAGSLIIIGDSSNTTLVPVSNIVFGGSGANRTISLSPAANQFGTTTITVTVVDGEDSAQDTFVLTVDAVNDAPVLDNSGDPVLTAIDEDTPAAAIMGNTVGAILATGAGGDPISDVDVGAVEGIAVIAVDDTNGEWQYSIDGGMNWLAVGAVSDSSALLLNTSAILRFVPDTDFNGTATFNFRAWDQTSGTNGGTGNAGNNGGITAFSTATETATITINSVNDVPTISDIGNQTTNEDTATGAIPFTVGDVETAAGSLIIIGNSSNTTLVPVSNIVFGGSGANRTISLSPAANQFGTTTITVTVVDGEDSAQDTFVLTVDAVNDAPVVTITAFPSAYFLDSIPEDDSNSSGTSVPDLIASGVPNISITDNDVGALQGLAITAANTANGAWQFSIDNGMNWNAMGAVANDNARLLAADGNTLVRFIPNADFRGFTLVGLTGRAWDQTSGTSGGLADTTTNGGASAFSTGTVAAVIFVTPVNDAPVLDNTGDMSLVAIDEDNTSSGGTSVANIITSAGGDRITDPDSGLVATALDQQIFFIVPEGVAVTAVDDSNGTWQYSIDNGMNWNAMGAVADNNARLLNPAALVRFVPDADFNGTPTVTFRAWDQTSGTNGMLANASINGGTTAFSTATETVSITVNAVNDAPVINLAVPLPLDFNLSNINEDDFTNNGTLVSDVVTSGGAILFISDVDAGAVQGLAIIGASTSNGDWEYSINGGMNWQDIGAVTNSNARLLAADANTRIRFVPDADFRGNSGLTIRAWDQTSGSNGGVGDASTNGGTTAFSSGTEIALLFVVPVNDAPILDNTGDMSLTAINEGDVNSSGDAVSSIISSAGGDRITDDVDFGLVSGPGSALSFTIPLEGIAIIAADTSNGTWQYSIDNGMNWNNMGAVANNNARLLNPNALVRFVPDADFEGTSDITFKAWDQTSGANGALADASVDGGITAFSTATETASITVNAINDAPVLDNSGNFVLSATNENNFNPVGYAISDLFGSSGANIISDVDNGALQGVAVVAVDTTNGTWQYSLDGGNIWTNITGVAVDNALLLDAANYIRYVPSSDFVGSSADSITMRAWDRTVGSAGNTADTAVNGGASAFSAATETITAKIGEKPPTTDAIIVSSPTDDPEDPVSTLLSNGNIAVVWQPKDDTTVGGYAALLGQIFDKNGNAVGSDFHVDSGAAANYIDPSIDTLVGGGGFVVTWNTTVFNTTNVRVFDNSGNPISSEVALGGVDPGAELDHVEQVAALQNGGFAVVYQDNDSDDIGVYLQRFDAAGSTVGSAVQVNQTETDRQTQASVELLNNGNFVVSWLSQDFGSGEQTNFVRIFDENGSAVTSEIQVTPAGQADVMAPSVAALDNNNFIVVWTAETGGDIFARLYQENGTPIGSAFTLFDTFNYSLTSNAIGLDDGIFAIVFEDIVTTNTPRIMVFNNDGSVFHEEFQLDDSLSPPDGSKPSTPHITQNGLIAAWRSGSDIALSFIDIDNAPVVSSAPPVAPPVDVPGNTGQDGSLTTTLAGDKVILSSDIQLTSLIDPTFNPFINKISDQFITTPTMHGLVELNTDKFVIGETVFKGRVDKTVQQIIPSVLVFTDDGLRFANTKYESISLVGRLDNVQNGKLGKPIIDVTVEGVKEEDVRQQPSAEIIPEKVMPLEEDGVTPEQTVPVQPNMDKPADIDDETPVTPENNEPSNNGERPSLFQEQVNEAARRFEAEVQKLEDAISTF